MVGGYFLFMYMSSASVASANNVNAEMRASDIAVVSAAGVADTADTSASPAKLEPKRIAVEVIVPRAATLHTDAEKTDAESGPVPGLAAGEAISFLEGGVPVYGNSSLSASIVDFDWAVEFHPKLLPAYLEPAVMFYRLQKFDGDFPGIAPAKAGRPKSALTIARKPRLDRTAVAPSVTPLWRWRTAGQYPSRREAVAQMR
jgi:hypothetical protein